MTSRKPIGLYNLPEHIGMFIEHNEHKMYYDPIEKAVNDIDDSKWVSPEEKQKALETNEIWSIQWFPKTPIGSYTFYASTLEALFKFIEENFNQ